MAGTGRHGVKRNETTLRSVQVSLSALITANSNSRHWFRIQINRPGSSDAYDLESSDLRNVKLTDDDLTLIAACCEEAITVRNEALFGQEACR
jgi:hypothetical protein